MALDGYQMWHPELGGNPLARRITRAAKRAGWTMLLTRDAFGISIRWNPMGSLSSMNLYDLTKFGGVFYALAFAASCASTPTIEAAEGRVYCGGGAIKRVIEYGSDGLRQENIFIHISEENTLTGEKTFRREEGITAYSWFGSNEPAPEGFVKALLLDNGGEILVFEVGNQHWIEYGDYTYRQCN